MVHRGAEGCSLQSGGCSSLSGEVGKRDQGVVAPFQERLVNESGGCSSLPGEAGKREQGVGAPFQERLVNECKWVPACW